MVTDEDFDTACDVLCELGLAPIADLLENERRRRAGAGQCDGGAERLDRGDLSLAWRGTDAYRDAFDSYENVPIQFSTRCALAYEAVDLAQLAHWDDDELLALPRMGRATLAELRAYLAE
jgi:hypothetical protein